MSKYEAIIKVLKVLKSAMMVVRKPNKEEALTLAEEHGITVRGVGRFSNEGVMKVENVYPVKWNSGQPFEDGQYLCAVMDCRKPVILSWYDDKKQWGEWTHGEYEDGMLEWEYFGNARVEYYMRLDDIPMPEGW